VVQYRTSQGKHSSWEAEEQPFLGQLGVEYTLQKVIPLIFRTAECDIKFLSPEQQSGMNELLSKQEVFTGLVRSGT